MSPPRGKFLPLHQPAPLGPTGKPDGCRYAYARGTCRAPRMKDSHWCEPHDALYRAEVAAQGGAVVLEFGASVPTVGVDLDYFSPARQAARDEERKRIRAAQVAASKLPSGGPLVG